MYVLVPVLLTMMRAALEIAEDDGRVVLVIVQTVTYDIGDWCWRGLLSAKTMKMPKSPAKGEHFLYIIG